MHHMLVLNVLTAGYGRKMGKRERGTQVTLREHRGLTVRQEKITNLESSSTCGPQRVQKYVRRAVPCTYTHIYLHNILLS